MINVLELLFAVVFGIGTFYSLITRFGETASKATRLRCSQWYSFIILRLLREKQQPVQLQLILRRRSMNLIAVNHCVIVISSTSL